MRSHVTLATPPAKAQLVHDSSASSTSAFSREAPAAAPEEVEERGGDVEGKGIGLCYGLRENPRKSFRLVDPEFSSSFPAVEAVSSSIVQDRESETESSRDPPSHRRRSKRPRQAPSSPPSEPPEPEPASSVSDTTPEEDVALSLMMLSRDFWTKTKAEAEDEDEEQLSNGWDEEDDAEEENEGQILAGRSRPLQPAARGRSKYQCGTCKKVFRSYQALGGHRASHKKSRGGCIPAVQTQIHDAESSEGNADREASKVHECPFCFRVFGSGQALGGHKRSHLVSSAPTTTITISSPAPLPPSPSFPRIIARCGENLSFIDLNLPAPLEDDTELSAVSDAEFIAKRRNHPSN
ncbi:zinc finger protein ZAT9-like [Cocos nucifera]|uniref:Zinc finger protein ZAT9-like n=1 Tax=Cocos nucifera TaxID=13894 RepID=A0A8K0N4K7_COCNU|nr:zinc finger protein ZAT9-like [Cocos nucifera]